MTMGKKGILNEERQGDMDDRDLTAAGSGCGGSGW